MATLLRRTHIRGLARVLGLRLRRWRSQMGWEPVRTTSYLGSPFVYPADSIVGQAIAQGREWDRQLGVLVEALLPARSPHVCDVGSNIGASLLQILRVRPTAKVVCFEPSHRFRPLLVRNLRAAGFAEVEILSLLVADRAGSRWLYNNESTATAATPDFIGHDPRGKERVDATTLDAVFASRDRLDFLKIDADGYDFRVLRGGEQVLRRDRPAIHFEYAPYLLTEPVVDLLWLQQLGYGELHCFNQLGAWVGSTRDAHQAHALAVANTFCDVLAVPDGTEFSARLAHVPLGEFK